MSANAEARWARKLFAEGKISTGELDDAERDARYEADRDEYEYEREETEQW